MDKNQTIGIILIFALIMGYTWLNAPTEEQLAQLREERIQDSLEQVRNLELEKAVENKIVESIALPDSILMAQNQGTYGAFSNASVGSEELVSLENDKIKITFSSKGASIKEAVLKDHYQIISDTSNVETKVNVSLMQDVKNRIGFDLPVTGVAGGIVNSGDLYYKINQQGNSIEFVVQSNQGGRFIQKYTIAEDYKLEYESKLENLQGVVIPREGVIPFQATHFLEKIEVNDPFEKRYSTVYFKESDESNSDYCSCTSSATEDPESSIAWFSHSNQFFNTSWIAKDRSFKKGIFETDMLLDDSKELKKIVSSVDVPFDNAQASSFVMDMYIGPNEYDDLASYDKGLEQIIPFGTSVFGTINRYVIRPAFNFLTGLISSKGLAIILMIFIIKMLLYPLTYKMLYSQAKMQALKPTLAKLTEKFSDDAQKKQVETMKIYREYGVSPLGGCMPMVIQMPIWYALFRFFPASITFRQESFLWANDLSSYDVIAYLPFEIPMFGAHISLFTILWAVTTVLYTYYNTKHMDMSANPAMKYVQYFMPLMFLFFFNNYASGLTCYMFFSNLFNILQTVLTKRFVFDNDKIAAELEKQKAKPKKKGGFQARLEEAMKQQQQLKQQQAAKKKRK